MATIYKILSPLMEECYVGSTICDVETRWIKHRSDRSCSSVLFNKYGYDNCKFIVLEVCPLEERFIKEQWWIDHSVGLVNERDAVLNPEKKKEYTKEWKIANAERYKEQRRLFYEANKEIFKERRKAYYKSTKK